MNLKKAKSLFQHNYTKTTLCFLKRDDEILLAMKKRGFGIGKWNGVGGKVQEDEKIIDAAIRETTEEIKVIPKKLDQVATLYFYFPHNDGVMGKAEETTVFMVTEWEGKPDETEEMKPAWFKINDLPYDSMWDDDKYWVPEMLAGKKITGEFLFDEEFRLVEHLIT